MAAVNATLDFFREVVTVLLEGRLVTPATIVASDLALVEESRRNLNLHVVSEQSPSYFVKQSYASKSNSVGVKYATVEYEAQVYDFLTTAQQYAAFRSHLPRPHYYDQARGILVLERIPGTSIGASNRGSGQIPAAVASELGRAIATLHVPDHHGLSGDSAIRYANTPPWSSVFPEPTEYAFRNMSAAALAFLGILSESTDLVAQLLELGTHWSGGEAVIHGDLRWENLISFSDGAPDGPVTPVVKVVDWELALLGDPAWDIAAFLSDFVTVWISSVPISGVDNPGEFLSLAGAPIDQMHLSVRSFWQSYADTIKLSPDDRATLLLRAVRNIGPRLIQLACEQLQEYADVTASSLVHLQLAANVIERPVETAVRLLGLPLGSVLPGATHGR